jgi:hypothetical protein
MVDGLDRFPSLSGTSGDNAYDQAVQLLLTAAGPNFALLPKNEPRTIRYALFDPKGSCLLVFDFLLYPETTLIYLVSWLQIVIDHWVSKESYAHPLLLESIIFRHTEDRDDNRLPAIKGRPFNVSFDPETDHINPVAGYITWDLTNTSIVKYWETFKDMILAGVVSGVNKYPPMIKLFSQFCILQDGADAKDVGSGQHFKVPVTATRSRIVNSSSFFGERYGDLIQEGDKAREAFGKIEIPSTIPYVAVPTFIDRQPGLGLPTRREARRIEAGLRMMEVAQDSIVRRSSSTTPGKYF